MNAKFFKNALFLRAKLVVTKITFWIADHLSFVLRILMVADHAEYLGTKHHPRGHLESSSHLFLA